MDDEYDWVYEGADLVLFRYEEGRKPREVRRSKDALWVWLMVMADQGKDIHKIQEFSFQRGFREAIELVRCHLGTELTKEQEETIEELDRDGTSSIQVYDQDYSDWDQDYSDYWEGEIIYD